MQQQAELIVTNPDAARALSDSLLCRFLEPQSPSDVASKLGMAANLVHHHAKKLEALGLLFEARREGRKVYYQLAARTFKYERQLLSAEDAEGRDVDELGAAFLRAYARSDRLAQGQDPEYTTVGFNVPEQLMAPTGEPTSLEALNGRPAHFQTRSFGLTPGRYIQLVRQISALIREAEREKTAGAGVCTLAFLAFDGAIQPEQNDLGSDGQRLSSFVPLG